MPKIIPKIEKEADRLAELGFSIVPCAGKKPTVSGWQDRAMSRDELRAALKGTKLNIAIALHMSDVIDVECDSDEAETALQALFDGTIPPTPTWQSKRGKHRLFRRPADLPSKAKIELDGIEFRIGNGKGALSILPPSKHPDGPRYKWLDRLSLDDVDPAELPDEIVDRLREPSGAESETKSTGTIPEGKRNDEMFRRACALRDIVPAETLLVAMLDANQRLCNPPLPDSEVNSIVESALKTEGKPGDNFLARLLDELDLWHGDDDEPYATVPQGEHLENWKIGKRNKSFARWLRKRFYDATKEMLGADGLSNMSGLLEGEAVFEGPQYRVWRRVAEEGEAFYLDLADDQWRAVEIDADGWRIVAEPPVKFGRAKAVYPLPDPVPSDDSLRDLLLPFLNIRIEQWPLVAAFLVAAMRPRGPYPILKLNGEQGSAKSTTARVLRSLLDPNAAPVRAEPRDSRDLMIAANNSWVICLDNLSTVKQDLSDALCRMATGGGFATRTLYTDEDETIFDAMRPVILTSIEEIGTRSDLLERSLIVDLPTIPEGKRRAEKSFWREFEAARPRILGALLDVVSGAIGRLPEIEARADVELSRMADFEQWGEAAEEPLGLEPGQFREAYRANQDTATQTVLESSPAIAALLKLLNKDSAIECTTTTLHEKLAVGNYDLVRQPGWPKTPRVLSAIIKRAAPNLRQVGIVATQDTRGGGKDKEKVWRIAKDGAVAKPETEKPPAKPSKTGDRIRDALSRSRVARNGRDAKPERK